MFAQQPRRRNRFVQRMVKRIDTDSSTFRSTMTGDVHRQLHWAAIRSVCRDHTLPPHTRRAKLRFLIDGLARSARWPAARGAASAH